MSTRRFVAVRMIHSLITLFLIATIIFVIFRTLPGDPTKVFIDTGMPEASQARIAEQFGLNDPLWVQLYKFLVSMATFDWGLSIHYYEPVFDILAPKLVNSLVLMLPMVITAFALAVGLGTLAGWYRRTKIDSTIVAVAFASRGVPTFVSGLLLLLVFSVGLGWFPIGRMLPSTAEYTGLGRFLNVEFLRHMTLPFLAGVMYYMSLPALLMRNTMISTMNEPFLNVLKAKGLSERTIMFKHAARNSLLPVSTAAALAIGYAVGGQVVLEYVFSWPGIGNEIVVAINRRDYPVAQAALMLMATAIIVMNFVADVAYTYLDPRVSYSDR